MPPHLAPPEVVTRTLEELGILLRANGFPDCTVGVQDPVQPPIRFGLVPAPGENNRSTLAQTIYDYGTHIGQWRHFEYLRSEFDGSMYTIYFQGRR